MALTKFIYPPESSSYAVADGTEVISVKLSGGVSRYRKDFIGATSTVDCTWIFDATRYKYFRSFYRALTEKGAIPFLIDLLLDEPTLTEHRAYFIPNSVNFSNVNGNIYTVTAQLEVYPADIDYAAEKEFAIMYSNFGEQYETYFPIREDIIDTIVNYSSIFVGIYPTEEDLLNTILSTSIPEDIV